MREKLMELLKNAKFDLTFPRGNNGKPLTVRGFNFLEPDLVPLFADYIIANGWIHLPCKVGDTVYRTADPSYKERIWEWEIEHIEMYADEVVFIDDSDNRFGIDDIGKTVFLTREEAEAALKEVE